MFTKALLASVAAAALLAALPAAAQSGPPAPPRLDDRFRNQAFHMAPDQALSDALMGGDGDLLLLQRTKLVAVHVSYARSGTDNAPLSPDDPIKDNYGVAEAGVEIGTAIAGHVRLSASAGVVSTQYSQLRALDYSAVTGAIGAQAHYAGVDLSLAWSPSAVYTSQNFHHLSLKQATSSAEISTSLRLGPVIIQPSAHYNRTLAHPSDYDNRAFGGRLTLVTRFKAKRPITLYLTGGYEQRLYDHYFPDLLGLDRKDKLTDVAVGARWQVTPALEISAQYACQRNRSTSDVSFYKAKSGMLGVSLSRRF